MTGFYTI